MPICVGADVRPMSHDDFLNVAYAVTGAAFVVHQEYGTMFAEKLYQHEVAAECSKRGLSTVQVEVPIRLVYDGFQKDYFADLLVGCGALFELKAVAELSDDHRAQTLNYLFMTGLRQAKLLNFGSAKVQHTFVSTTLSPQDRRQFTIHRDRWTPINSHSIRFQELLLDLLNDWGGFLQLPAYYEGITHFFGGKDAVIRDIPVLRDLTRIAIQTVHLLDPETAFKLTAKEGSLEAVDHHLSRFLATRNCKPSNGSTFTTTTSHSPPYSIAPNPYFCPLYFCLRQSFRQKDDWQKNGGEQLDQRSN